MFVLRFFSAYHFLLHYYLDQKWFMINCGCGISLAKFTRVRGCSRIKKIVGISVQYIHVSWIIYLNVKCSLKENALIISRLEFWNSNRMRIGKKSSFWVIFWNTIHKLAQIQLNPNPLLVSNLHLVAINLYMIWSIFMQGPEADH